MTQQPLFKPPKTHTLHLRVSNEANELICSVSTGIQCTPSEVIRKCARFILAGKKARRLKRDEKKAFLSNQTVILTIRDVPVTGMDTAAFKAVIIARCIDARKEIEKIPVFKTNLKEGVDYIVANDED